MHFDTGIKCSNSFLCGDWGGYTRTVAEKLEYCRKREILDTFRLDSSKFAKIRVGIFRYSLTACFVPFSPYLYSDYFAFKHISFEDEDHLSKNSYTFAHECGHSLGLEHSGHRYYGFPQLKPNYTSLMNTVFGGKFNGNEDNNHFSNGSYPELNPEHLCENIGISGRDPLYLSYDLFSYLISGSGVDWNRDGYIENDCTIPVVAFTNSAKSGATGLPAYRIDKNVMGGLSTNYTPALCVFNGNLYLFYASSYDKRIKYSKLLSILRVPSSRLFIRLFYFDFHFKFCIFYSKVYPSVR